MSDTTQTTEPANELEPTSASGYARFLSGEHPAAERIDDATFTVGIPLPHPGIVTSTLCYVLVGGDGVGHVIDPGWNSDENFAILTQALTAWGIERVGTVFATHLHDDHLGMADRVRQHYGAALAFGRHEWDAVEARAFDLMPAELVDIWGVPEQSMPELPTSRSRLHEMPEPDLLIDDGDVLDLGRPLRAVMTPGHSQGGISLVDVERRRVVTGDHVMPHINPGLGLGYVGDDDPVGDYYESAERLLEWDGFEVLPGHGYRFGQLGRRVTAHISHHLRRSREVAAVHSREPEASVWETAAQLTWTAGWDGLTGFYRFSALAQTAMHVRFVRDAARAERWLNSDY